MSTVIGFFGDNAGQVDAVERDAQIREEYPKLLQADEKILVAFVGRAGKGRDSILFTNKRLIMIDRQGMSGKKTDFFSVGNSSIQAFAVETAGGMDSDCELTVYAEGLKTIKLSFCKGIDVFALQTHLNNVVLKEGSTGAQVPAGAGGDAAQGATGGGFFRWFGDDNTQIDAKEIEGEFKKKQVLLQDESVELAFKCGRDSFLLTSHRLLKVNVQGFTGKRAEYLTISWPSIRAFSIETAGHWDNDSELLLFTNLEGMTRIPMDFKKRKADIFAVQRFISDKLLGMDTVDPSANADSHTGFRASLGNMFSWAGDDSRMVDETKMDKQYHSNPPILQHCETVEMAFKGRRDLTLFTGKRLLLVDMKGATAKKVDYFSVPWSSVQAFGVRSAGSVDKDAEMLVWTGFDDIIFPPKEDADVVAPPPIPRRSFLELDFNKDSVDMMVIQRYLADRCLHVDGGLPPNDVPVAVQPSSSHGVSSFLSWFSDDSMSVDPQKLDHQLHEVNPVLRDDEHVSMAFKNGRDMTILTTKRVLIMDTRGMSGKKIEWISIPYTSLRSFSCETAGGFGDRDSELRLYCKIYWYGSNPGNVIEQDFRKGKADIIEIQSFLSKQMMGSQDGSSGLDAATRSSSGTSSGGSFNFLSDDGVEVDPAQVNEELRPILADDETVDVAFKIGRRDMCIFSTKRILMVDRQGMTGKKTEYKTVPLRYCTAFKLKTGGSFSDAEAIVYTDVPGQKEIQQDLKKSKSDIWAIQSMLATKLLK